MPDNNHLGESYMASWLDYENLSFELDDGVDLPCKVGSSKLICFMCLKVTLSWGGERQSLQTLMEGEGCP